MAKKTAGKRRSKSRSSKDTIVLGEYFTFTKMVIFAFAILAFLTVFLIIKPTG